MKTSSGLESVGQCLTSFAIFAILAPLVLLAAAGPAEAEIVYTRANITIKQNSSYSLDLNSDGVTDLVLSISHLPEKCPFAHTGVYDVFSETPASGNGAAGSPPARLISGTEIGPNQTFYAGTGTMASLLDCEFISGAYNWINNQYCGYDCFNPIGLKGYLGVTFQIDGETHYGWALLSVTVKKATAELVVVLNGYAYETVPGMPINAGQTTDGTSALSPPGPAKTEHYRPELWSAVPRRPYRQA
jgi:hypothetical protein